MTCSQTRMCKWKEIKDKIYVVDVLSELLESVDLENQIFVSFSFKICCWGLQDSTTLSTSKFDLHTI